MVEFYRQQDAERTGRLEEQVRAAVTAEGHANCLQDLLHFHEDQGQLVSSYWRAQCEKRDDSIRFLTLKLQEYTLPSDEYRARRRRGRAGCAARAGRGGAGGCRGPVGCAVGDR